MLTNSLRPWMLLDCAGYRQCLCTDWTDIWAVSLAKNGRAALFDWILCFGGVLVTVATTVLGHEVPTKAPEHTSPAGDGRREAEYLLLLTCFNQLA